MMANEPPIDLMHTDPVGFRLLLDELHEIGGDAQLIAALQEIEVVRDLRSMEIVRTAAELAIAREHLLAITSPPDPIEELLSARKSYSEKLDDARIAAALASNAADVFDSLLRSQDPRMVEAALLAMGEGVAKEMRTSLIALRERRASEASTDVDEGREVVEELTNYLLIHGDPAI
jgi:hypothetical protein